MQTHLSCTLGTPIKDDESFDVGVLAWRLLCMRTMFP
jgi:hypothetical protein